MYGQASPPNYDLSKITMPVHIYYGDDDYLVNVTDVERLLSELPNGVGHLISVEGFKHSDFTYAMYAAEVALLPMIDTMDELFEDAMKAGAVDLKSNIAFLVASITLAYQFAR